MRKYINDKYLCQEHLRGLRHDFLENEIVILPSFLSDFGKEVIFSEIDRLLEKIKRREILKEPSSLTPRIMFTMGSKEINELSRVISNFYRSAVVRNILRVISGEEVFIPADENEDVVLNQLLEPGDIHGAHVDTYAFAFNIVRFSVRSEQGGALLVYPGSGNPEDLNKEETKRYSFNQNDAYLLRTDRNIHCVSPLKTMANRTILNMAYASEVDKDLISYSSQTLYS